MASAPKPSFGAKTAAATRAVASARWMIQARPKLVSVRTAAMAHGSVAALQSSLIEPASSASHTTVVRSTTPLAASTRRRIGGASLRRTSAGAWSHR